MRDNRDAPALFYNKRAAYGWCLKVQIEDERRFLNFFVELCYHAKANKKWRRLSQLKNVLIASGLTIILGFLWLPFEA